MQWRNTGDVTCHLAVKTVGVIKNLYQFENMVHVGYKHTGHFAEKDLRNRKHWPKARERQTEARAYWRERDRCGWTGRPTKPGRLAANKHIVQDARYPQRRG